MVLTEVKNMRMRTRVSVTQLCSNIVRSEVWCHATIVWPNLQDKSMLELVFAPCSPIAGGGVNWNLDFMTSETGDRTLSNGGGAFHRGILPKWLDKVLVWSASKSKHAGTEYSTDWHANCWSISLYSGEKNLWSTWTKNTDTQLPTNKFLHCHFRSSLLAVRSFPVLVVQGWERVMTRSWLQLWRPEHLCRWGGIFGSKHFLWSSLIRLSRCPSKHGVTVERVSFEVRYSEHDSAWHQKCIARNIRNRLKSYLVTNFENMTRCAVSNRKVPGNFRFIQLGRNRHPIATWKPSQLKFAQSSKSSKAFHSRECLVSNPIFRKFPGSFVWHFELMFLVSNLGHLFAPCYRTNFLWGAWAIIPYRDRWTFAKWQLRSGGKRKIRSMMKE